MNVPEVWKHYPFCYHYLCSFCVTKTWVYVRQRLENWYERINLVSGRIKTDASERIGKTLSNFGMQLLDSFKYQLAVSRPFAKYTENS